MPNGNLDTWLHGNFSGGSSKCLSLAQRASIAIGIADALAYLHHDCERQIVHCDLKPTNILLDDDMNAYLGDFGIASLVGHSSSNTSTGLKGTIGYIAPGIVNSRTSFFVWHLSFTLTNKLYILLITAILSLFRVCSEWPGVD
jgi:serine/threonine protein kinase